MKTVKILTIFFTFLFTSFAFAPSFKPGSEPNGFRDVEWGKELSTLSGMEYYKNSNPASSPSVDQRDLDHVLATMTKIYLEIYLKMEDELTVEGTEVKKIEYGFWKGKFCEVNISTKGFENWVSLNTTTLS